MEPNTQFSPRVLLAIDDLRLRRTNEAGLRSAGFAVSAPSDAEAVTILAESFSPDVLVVDTEMHDKNSRPLYQQLRSSTRQLHALHRIGRSRPRPGRMLRSGADDAVSMPVTPDEIAARCQAMLRRPREMRTDWDPSSSSR